MAVKVYFATNRQPYTDPGSGRITRFGDDPGPVGGLNVRYGSADVDVDLDARTNTMVAGSLQVADEQLIPAQGGQPQLGSSTIFDALRNDMKTSQRPTIAFIHGFSNSFTDAIERAGWISAFYGLDANMFVFTWPSRGSPLGVPLPYTDYTHDRKTAVMSGPAVARTIRRLHDYVDSLPPDLACDQPIHLLCHSMGNYVLRNALQALMRLPDPTVASHSGEAVSDMVPLPQNVPDPSVLRRTFDKIVLAAADEDADAFDDPAKLKFLPRIGQSVSVYHSLKDWVLNTLSDRTKFNGPRLGSDGPDNMATISDKVTAIDCADVTSFAKDPEEHQYYRVFPVVRNDIVQVLRGVPQNKVRNRAAVSQGRYRIKPA
ncbi:alpha/beta fold hydrolase [Mesorhizobium loti]|uniref:Alpha/beta fold hydrolase n=1 Tax=Mesorhizobium loti R88b TaxID=935548 RepID=A0A6M7WMW2_RHILI|nr:alpha/beta fold hydrolase [Mesorhizobium loti]QKD01268.1 alpha/beta fold hydrolase [Mesorhizobium loti R88b]